MFTVTGCRLLLVVEHAVEGHLRDRNSVGGVGLDLVAVDDVAPTLERTRYSDRGMPGLARTRSHFLLKQTRSSLRRHRWQKTLRSFGLRRLDYGSGTNQY